MKILESIKGTKLVDLGYEDYYFKAENIHVRLYNKSIYIRNLDNAMKKGKIVNTTVIYLDKTNNFRTDLINYLFDKEISFDKFCIDICNNIIPSDLVDRFNWYCKDDKSFKVFSPFVKYKSIDKLPKNPTLAFIRKILLSDKLVSCECDTILTDDYYFDYISNFGKGKICPMEFAKELIEEPTGWHVGQFKKINDNLYEVDVVCYSFKFNKVVFSI